MEVKEPSAKYLAQPAYKQTEVGVIPEDWNAEKLGAHSTFRTGPFGSALHQSDYVDDGIPVINPMQLIEGKIAPTSSMSISESTAKKLSDFRLVENEVIIGRRGDMGRCAVVQAAHSGWLCGTGSMIIRCNASLNPDFAQRVLSSPQVIAEIENTSVGTTMINLNQGTLRNLLIPVPPTLTEQQAIATALSDADALIESLQQLLTKKRQIKQGAMQELLTGQKRLPGFGGAWEETTLGAIAEKIVGGGTPSRNIPLYWNGNIPWMTVKDFANFSPLSTLEYITKDGLASSASNLIPAGTLITSTRMAIGKAVIFEVDVCINQDLKAIYLRKDIDPCFLYFWFQFNESLIAGLGSGSTVMGISLSELRKLQVLKPPYAEQTAIATVLSDMDAELAALEAKLTKARQIKLGMMQELLTGRIRLVQAQAEVIPFPAQTVAAPKKSKPHNRQIEEAVMLGVLAQAFASEQHPLARVRRTKLLYLFHRHIEGVAEGYLKKAAGPYNPKTRYQGAEGIAVKNGYVIPHHNGTYEGFIAGDKVAVAAAYFDKWHEPTVRAWLEQFRYTKTDELELLATVDMAMEDLRHAGNPVSPEAVKQIIQSHPEWQAKLARDIFSDANIERALAECHNLFGD